MGLARRFLPLFVALAVALAPAALAACEASCATHGSAAAPPSHHVAGHTHHHALSAESTSASAAVAGVPRACSHTGDLPVVDGASHVVVVAPVAVIPPLVAPVAPSRPVASGDLVSERSSDRTALATQLRV